MHSSAFAGEAQVSICLIARHASRKVAVLCLCPGSGRVCAQRVTSIVACARAHTSCARALMSECGHEHMWVRALRWIRGREAPGGIRMRVRVRGRAYKCMCSGRKRVRVVRMMCICVLVRALRECSQAFRLQPNQRNAKGAKCRSARTYAIDVRRTGCLQAQAREQTCPLRERRALYMRGISNWITNDSHERVHDAHGQNIMCVQSTRLNVALNCWHHLLWRQYT